MGIRPIAQALAMVDPSSDLVLVSPHQNPPVCKIIPRKNASEESKAVRMPKEAVHSLSTKEIEVNSTISTNDLNVKLGKCRSLLEKGHRVQITLVERARKPYNELFKVMLESLSDIAVMVNSPKVVRSKITVLLSRKKEASKPPNS